MDDGFLGYIVEPVRNDSLTVGTSSILIAEVRPSTIKRKDILVRNISASATAIISITMGQAIAVANKGIVLKQGESFTMSTSEGNECYQGQISAISNEAGATVSIFER